MALTDLDTRVALMAQTPQVDFNQLLNNSLDTYNTVKGMGQQGILSRLLAQNTGADGQVNLAGALQSAQTNPNQAYQSGIVNILSNSIKQQNEAKLKAQQEAEKQRIDNAKTVAETKDKELGNTQKGQTLLSNLIATSTDATDAAKKLEILGSQYGLPPETIEATKAQLTGLAANNQGGPDAFENMRKSYGLLGANDPIKYMTPEANTVANNEASNANNIRDNQTKVLGITTDAETANKDRLQKQSQFTEEQKLANWIAKNKPIDEFTAPDGTRYNVYPGGKGIPVSDPNGTILKAQAKEGGLSATMQKELIQTDDAISGGQAVISGLKDALSLNTKSYDGFTALQRAKASGFIHDSEESKNTVLIDNVVTGNALNALKSTFGAAPTEGERKILLELQGSVNLPAQQRKAIWQRAINAAENRIKYNQQKAEAIRNGTFTSTTYKPYKAEDISKEPKNTKSQSNNAVTKASSKWGI